MRKIHLSTKDLLHLAGLEKRGSFFSRALPIAAGVGAGLVAGAVVSFALLTPARRERLADGVKGLWRGRAAKSPYVPPLHTDAPGTDLAHEVHQNAPAAHA
jgi:hypothetical protein